MIGSIFQRLVPLREGKGRAAAVEVLKKSPRIKELIEKNEIKSIREEMENSVTLHRMQTFEQSLIALIVNKKITYKEAASLSLMPGEMKLAMDQLGINENGDILEKGALKDGPRVEF
jgi:twitching motility protein PilU